MSLFCFSSLSIGHQVVASSYPVSLFFLRDELMGISDEPVYKDKILELLARADHAMPMPTMWLKQTFQRRVTLYTLWHCPAISLQRLCISF